LWLYNPFGYAGQYTDQESGLVYMRARYYDPATEQFISRDPMEGVSGQPYVYAGASPLNATDVSGRFLDTLFDIAAIGMDVKDIADNGLSWENGLTLVADVGLALVPIAPAIGGAGARGAKALAHADDVAGGANAARTTLIHYTSESGYRSIMGKPELWASTGTKNARYGHGQYLTDITPEMIGSGELTRYQVARRLYGWGFGAGGKNTPKLSHFIEIDITGLVVENPAAHIFLIPNEGPLDLTGRIVRSGRTP
jgi:RHS repeat-associated protein